MTLGWIAQRLQMGTKTHLVHLLYWHEKVQEPTAENRRSGLSILRTGPFWQVSVLTIELFAAGNTYNGKGEQVYSTVDMNQNWTNDFGGTDRITFTTNDVVLDHSTAVRRTRTYVWAALNSAVSNLVSVSETSTNGLQSWQVQYRDASTSLTNHSVTLYGSGGARTVTTTAADGSYAVSVYSYGRLATVTRYDSTGAPLGQTTYGYDAQGNQSTVTDTRNGTTTYTFNNAGQTVTTTTPAPGTFGDPAQTSTTSYDTSLRACKVLQPDGTSVTNVFLPTGELGLISGLRTYPVGYSYDNGGRMKTMTNWSKRGAF